MVTQPSSKSTPRTVRPDVVADLRALRQDGRWVTIPMDSALLGDGVIFPVRVSDDNARAHPSTSGVPDSEMTGIPPTTTQVRQYLATWALKCVAVATGARRIDAQRWVELLASCSDAELEAAYAAAEIPDAG